MTITTKKTKTTKETITVSADRAMVKIYKRNDEIERVTIAWPQTDGSISGWFEHEVEDYSAVLIDLFNIINPALSAIYSCESCEKAQ